MSLIKNTFFVMFLLVSTQCYQEESDYYSKDPEKYKSADSIECTTENCKEPNFCSSENDACYCNKGLANYPFSGYKGVYCSYQQHKQLTSFLWELLTNMGIGHFIIGNHLEGVFKMLIMLTPIVIQILGITQLVKVGFGKGTTATIFQSISIVFAVAAFTWWLYDAIMFGTNKHRDDLDVPLAHW